VQDSEGIGCIYALLDFFITAVASNYHIPPRTERVCSANRFNNDVDKNL
jgi:hypothetical protein